MQDASAPPPMDRSRALSTSGQPPNVDGDSLPEATASLQSPTKENSENGQGSQTFQDSPRRCQTTTKTRHHQSKSRDLAKPPSHTSLSSTEPSISQSSPLSCAPTDGHFSGPVEPPVTKATLSELDVQKIVQNPKLRHDINFDPELHFRPNLDGEKGRRKQDKAKLFWTAMNKDLRMFVTDRPAFYEEHGDGDKWTLPLLLQAVKDIIKTLVPQRDREFLEEGLNVELLMQQFHKGVIDLEKLASWLSRVLKSHCAPMRDEWVDTMYNQLSNGNKNQDLEELVTGMSSLLSVLEAMKLDVANHQIRCLRLYLIEDTINFEQKFFCKKIRSRRMSIREAKEWYHDAHEKYSEKYSHESGKFGDMGVFFEGLSRLILPSALDKRLPNTFSFDEERIMKLRSDMLDAINLEICLRLYEDLDIETRSSLAATLMSQKLEADNGDFNFNSPLETSRPSSLVFSSAGSAASSPRSSLVLPSYVASDNFVENKAKTQELFNSLVALLQTQSPASRPSERWLALAPAMALQIFRFTNAPTELLPVVEEKMMSILGNVGHPYYQDAEQLCFSRLMDGLAVRVREFKSLSGNAIFSAATGSRGSASGRATDSGREGDLDTLMRDTSEEGGLDDIATRIAHLGVLHWRVWAPIVYVGDVNNATPAAPANSI